MTDRPHATANRVDRQRVQDVGLSGEPGTFSSRGAWIPDRERTEAYAFVRYLIVEREGGASPQTIARLVAHSKFPALLGFSGAFWERLPHGRCWPLAIAHSATSAAATVARFRSMVVNDELPLGCDCWWCSVHFDAEASGGPDSIAAQFKTPAEFDDAELFDDPTSDPWGGDDGDDAALGRSASSSTEPPPMECGAA